MKRNAVVFLSGLLFVAHATANTPDWIIEKPYDNNPLVTATIAGNGTTGVHHGQVWLTLNCRKDAPPAFVTLHADAPLSTNFPISLFEGPGAEGEHSRLISRQGGQQSWLSTGAWQADDTFEWTFTPTTAELQHWADSAGSPLDIVVSTKEKKQTLTASFVLPATHTFARTLAPCLN